jgi:hypothetical protein
MVPGTTGGRPAAAVITKNFTRLEALANKSGRYYWKCNHCPDGTPGSHIEGRDNKHVKHLTDPRKCPNASESVRKEARVFLAGKGDGGDIVAVTPDQEGQESSDVQAVRVVKKRRGLEGIIDYALTPAQKQRADVKLFR